MPRWVTQQPVVERYWTSQLSALEGHTGVVESVAFSPIENLVLSTSRDETARLWDYITGTERFRFDEGETFSSGAFSPDGKFIALGSESGRIRIKEFGKGSSIDLEGHDDDITHVTFSPKHTRTLASTSDDNTVRIWNLDERKTTHICRYPDDYDPQVAEFTSDGRFLLVGYRLMSLKMWDVEKGGCVRTFDDANTKNVRAIAIFKDGETAALIQPAKTCLFDLSAGKRLFEASYDRDSHLASISLLPPDEKLILVIDARGSCEIRDVRTWSVVSKLCTPCAGNVFSVSRDGELLVSGGEDDQLRLWDLHSTATGNDSEALARSHRFALRIELSPDESLVISSSPKKAARLWDATNGHMKSLPADPVKRIHLSPNGRHIALELDTDVCQLWDKSLESQILDFRRLRNIVFSPDGKIMALLPIEGGVQTVDSTTFQEIMTWETSDTAKLEFSPNSQIIGLSDCDDKSGEDTFEVWDLPRRTRLWRTTVAHSESRRYSARVKFSPNGHVAAYRWIDAKEPTEWNWNLLNVATGKEKKVPGKGTLVFHPDSSLFAFAAPDNFEVPVDPSITLYETTSFKSTHVVTLSGIAHDSEPATLQSMAISATGQLACVASSSKAWRGVTVQMWDTKNGTEIGRYVVEGLEWIGNLSFSDDQYLVCAQGRLPVLSSLPDQAKKDAEEIREDSLKSLFVGSQWVYRGLERVLWIPPAYRSHASVLKGETLALVHESGAVRIVKFNLAETPVSNVQQREVHLLS